MGDPALATSSADAGFPMEALVTAALPVHNAEEMLRDLAAVWRDRLQARVVVLALIDEPWRGPLAVRADASGVRDLSRPQVETGAHAADGLRGALLRAAGEGDAGQWIPLADSGEVIGGALVWHPPDAKPDSCPAGWITITARLLAVARDYHQQLLVDKLEAMAEFAAGAGHEIHNPLGSILIASRLLLKAETDPERRRLLSTIGGQTLRVRDMIGDAMLFGRPPQPDLETLDLSAEVQCVASRFAEQFNAQGVDVSTDYADDVQVRADRTQLAVVVSELLRNALDALNTGGRVQISVRAGQSSAAPTGVLTVRDNGKGLTETEREHLFDPFFSGRQAGRGLGFGLPKAWRIVNNHGGRISVADNEDAGVTLRVEWPA